MERSAAWLPADTPETAARACADLTALVQHLRAIGVDGDGLVWIPRGELVTAEDLATLLRDAPAAGLLPLIGVTSHAAANLAVLAGATLIHRIADPALASRLAELTGTWMLPAPAAAALAGPMPTAVPAPPVTSAASGAPTMPGTDLVRCPVIPPRTLRALRRGEFVLAVNVPRRRLIALGRLIPARLPRREEPPRQAEPPRAGEPLHREAPPHRQEPSRQAEPPDRAEPPPGRTRSGVRRGDGQGRR